MDIPFANWEVLWSVPQGMLPQAIMAERAAVVFAIGRDIFSIGPSDVAAKQVFQAPEVIIAASINRSSGATAFLCSSYLIAYPSINSIRAAIRPIPGPATNRQLKSRIAGSGFILFAAGEIIQIADAHGNFERSKLRCPSMSTAFEQIGTDQVAFGDATGQIHIGHLQDKHPIRTLSTTHADQVTALVFCCPRKDGTYHLISGSRDGTILRWDGNFEHQPTRLFTTPQKAFVTCLAARSEEIFVGDSLGFVHKITAHPAQPDVSISAQIHRDAIRSVDTAAAIDEFCSTADDYLAKRVSTATLDVRQSIGTERNYVSAAAPIPNTPLKAVILGTSSGDLVHCTISGEVNPFLNLPNDLVRCVNVLGDQRVAAGTDAGYFAIYDLATRERLFEHRFSASVFSIAASAGGRFLYLGLRDGTLVQLALSTWDLVSFDRHRSIVGDISLFGNKLLTGSDDGTLRISETNNLAIYDTLELGVLAVNNIALAAPFAFLGCDSGNVAAVNTVTGVILFNRNVHSAPVRALCATDNILYSGDRAGLVKATRITDWTCMAAQTIGKRIVAIQSVDAATILAISESGLSRLEHLRTN